jgi:hypothetical protein
MKTTNEMLDPFYTGNEHLSPETTKEDLIQMIAKLQAELQQVKLTSKVYTFSPVVQLEKTMPSGSVSPKYGRLGIRLRHSNVPTYFWLSEIEDFLKPENLAAIDKQITENYTTMFQAEEQYLATKR